MKYWLGFRVLDGTRAIVISSYYTYEEAMVVYEDKKRFLRLGEQLSTPVWRETEDEALSMIKTLFGE